MVASGKRSSQELCLYRVRISSSYWLSSLNLFQILPPGEHFQAGNNGFLLYHYLLSNNGRLHNSFDLELKERP